MKKYIFYSLITLLILGCSNTTNSIKVNNKQNINSAKNIYTLIYKKIYQKDIDGADDLYIKLKTDFENSDLTKKAAKDLAIIHMQNKEYILANFYLQEALSIDSNDEFTKFLLIKNQFLAALENQRDVNYMQKALKALELNRNLVYSDDYVILANSMLTRVKLDMLYKNIEIGSLYQKLNKTNAAKLYLERAKELGIDSKEIYKP